jgi:hypothetical protein
MPSLNTLHTYYVAEAYNVKQYNAGIVRNDNERILEEEGFTALQFRYAKEGSLPVKLLRLINTVQLAFSIKKNSLVVFHFPLLANAYKWLLQILKWRGIKTAALIIDLDGIRDKDEMLLKEEIKLLQQFTYLIAHNPAMKKKLLEYLPSAEIFTIDLFDYPSKGEPIKRQLSNIICFAGNIAKAKFTYSLHQLPGLQFNVYGLGYDGPLNIKGGFIYKGTVAPDVLPAVLEGSFGLVWDGDSIEKCDDYLRYNNPHKLSLYLVAGVPVIVWKDSAVAALVEENNIGFTVDSLAEIPAKLNAFTSTAYESMQQKVLITGEQISKGYFLRKVMDEIKAL